MTKYPNLLELHKYHPYGEPAICDHAGIDLELLQAVLCDGVALEEHEIRGIARLYGLPFGLISAPVVSMLDMTRYRHRRMAADVDLLYMRLKYMALMEHNDSAVRYLSKCGWIYHRFTAAVKANRLTYAHYFGTMEYLEQLISFSAPKPERRKRGLQRK